MIVTGTGNIELLFPMPTFVFTDTLTVFMTHGRKDPRSQGYDRDQGTAAGTIQANVGKPALIPATIAERQTATLQVQFTTPSNLSFVDPSGVSRPIRRGDGLVWQGDGKFWTIVGPLEPRNDPLGNPVHWWGLMERVA
jgi:hypothetical protein